MTDETPGFIVKRRGPSTARADFACLAKACQTAKGSRVYDLPANATHCPMGHKRLQRIYTAPHISRGIAKRSDAALEPDYVRQRQQKDRAKERQRTSPMLAVDPNGPGGLSGAVARATGLNLPIGAPGAAKPTLGVTSPDLAGIKAAGANNVPRQVVGKWVPEAKDIEAARRTT